MTSDVNYYKATRPDGTDFQTGQINYAAALEDGSVLEHPGKPVLNHAETYFSVSVSPADCAGFRWPCRLFRVEPEGEAITGLSASPNKRAVSALRVIEELPAWQALGPNGQRLASFIERLVTFTEDQWRVVRDTARAATWDAARVTERLAARLAARDAARAAARLAARDAAWHAAWEVAWDASPVDSWDAAWDAVWDATLAITVADLISVDQYAFLTQSFICAGLGEMVDAACRTA